MTGDPTIFDGETLLAEALETVASHSNPEWWAECVNVVRRLAATGTRFTSDDLHASLDVFCERRGITSQNTKAIGAVLRQAARDGVVVALDEYRPSTRPQCHHRPVRCWVGLI